MIEDTTRPASAGPLQALALALLEADPHAVFLVDATLTVLASNARARGLLMSGDLVQRAGAKLKGRRNAFHHQLCRAVDRLLAPTPYDPRAASGDPGSSPVRFQAETEPRFCIELTALEVAGAPPVLMRVYDGFTGPDTAEMPGVERILRPANTIHRDLSADGHHGPLKGAPRPPPPPWPAVQGFEAFARLGSVAAAARELETEVTALSRQIGWLEAWTRRPLIWETRQTQRLTPAGRRLALALTAAIDIIEAAAKPSPPGRKRGPRPASPASANDVPPPDTAAERG